MQTQRRYSRFFSYLILALALVCNNLWAGPLIGIPRSPQLSQDGYSLILEHEVGGGEKYYNRFLIHPEWPEGYSGITIGVGEDLGYVSPSTFLKDWRELQQQDKDRLVKVVGLTGQRAKSRLSEVRDIIVKWNLAEGVFNEVTIPRYWALTKSTFPGFELLHPNAQASLLSIVFNRGSSLAGPGRTEMREIARLAPKKDYKGMAAQIRAMKRLWIGKGQDGLLRRRDDEARLMETAK